MAKTMTPSDIKAGQIGKIQELLGAALRKSGLQSEPTQDVLEHEGDQLTSEMVAIIRARVERRMNTIIRVVRVNRTRTQQVMLDAVGRVQYTDKSVVATMPKGEGDEVEVHFTKLNRFTSVDDLEREADEQGFKFADPYAVAAVNEADPSFADEHPNGTQWRDDKGCACFAAFGRWSVGRFVSVRRRDGAWYDRWWVARVRK